MLKMITAGLLSFSIHAHGQADSGYDERPLPKVTADLDLPAAPVKSVECVPVEVQAQAQTWSELSVSALARSTKPNCESPLRPTAAESIPAPLLRR